MLVFVAGDDQQLITGHVCLNLAQLEVPVQQILAVLFVQTIFSKLAAQRDVSDLKNLLT